MIEFACETATFSDLRLSETLGTIARLGFRYVDLDMNAHLNVVKIMADPRRIATELITDLRVYNLKLANISLALPAGLLSDDQAERQSALDQFDAIQPMLQALAVPGLTIGVLPPEDDDAGDEKPTRKKAKTKAGDDVSAAEEADIAEQRLKNRIGVLQHLIAAASPLEIRIAHTDRQFFADDDTFQPALIAVLDAVPELELVADAAMIAAKIMADEAESLSDLMSRTTHLRLRTAPKGFSPETAQRLMQHLAAVEYDGMLAVGRPDADNVPAPAKGAPAPMSPLRQVLTLRDTLRAARDQTASA